jgi:NAD(P)H dehydrogenase (quinone)
MILVTGAAGKTGLAILRALAKRGTETRALVGRAEQETSVMQAGASKVVIGNLLDAADMARAIADVESLYLVAPNVHPQEFEIARIAIAAAKRAGVRRIVYHSVLYPQLEAMTHHWQKLRVEEAVIQSGLEFIILQPASYMQNVLAYWDAIATQGEYRVPYSIHAPFTPVDLEDVAEIAAAALLEDKLAGGIFPLAGPDRLTSAQMALQMTQVLGREIHAFEQPLEVWRRHVEESGLSTDAVEALAKMFAYYGKHGFTGNSRTLASLLGRTPSKFSAFLHRSQSEK